MSSRERWTIYPLLFFALAMAGSSLYSRSSEVRVHRLVCDELVVAAPDGQTRIRIEAGSDGTGAIMVYDRQQRPAVAMRVTEQGGGLVESFGQKGQPTVLLGTFAGEMSRGDSSRSPDSGGVLVFGAERQPVVALGVSDQTHAGIIETRDSRGAPVITLGSSSSGGMLETRDTDGNRLLLGYGGQHIRGLLSVDSEGKVLVVPLGDDKKQLWGLPLPGPTKKTEPEEPSDG